MDENARSRTPLDAAHVMREALVTSAIRSAQFAEALGLPADRIILACKVSNVQDLIAVYTELASRCDYPLHLGLTEAGMGTQGHRRLHRRARRAAAAGHRRHDPRLAHARAQRRSHAAK